MDGLIDIYDDLLHKILEKLTKIDRRSIRNIERLIMIIFSVVDSTTWNERTALLLLLVCWLIAGLNTHNNNYYLMIIKNKKGYSDR